MPGGSPRFFSLAYLPMERRYRLTRSRDYARVQDGGNSWTHRLAVLTAAPNGLEISRFGFIASRRLGNAVKRNRAKRLLREAVWESMASVSAGWDCVLVARAPLPGATLAETKVGIVQLLKAARLWSPSPRRAGRAAGGSLSQPGARV